MAVQAARAMAWFWTAAAAASSAAVCIEYGLSRTVYVYFSESGLFLVRVVWGS